MVPCLASHPITCSRPQLPAQIDFLEAFSDITAVLLYGVALGWFVGVARPRRFRWLFSRQRWYVWATLFGTPPLYSAIR